MTDIVDTLRAAASHPYNEHGPHEWCTQAADEITHLRARVAELEGAVVWALGYTDFEPRPEGAGAYWWRKELSKRTGLGQKQCEEILALIEKDAIQ